MVQNSSELGGLHMQPITKLNTIGVEYIGAKCAKGRVVFLTAFRVRTWRKKSERKNSARKVNKRANSKLARQRSNQIMWI